jgi:hypothetical protein
MTSVQFLGPDVVLKAGPRIDEHIAHADAVPRVVEPLVERRLAGVERHVLDGTLPLSGQVRGLADLAVSRTDGIRSRYSLPARRARLLKDFRYSCSTL